MYQYMEATRGNQKPHEDSTQGFGAEIFYKPRRNVVPGERISSEELHDVVLVLELHSGDEACVGPELRGMALCGRQMPNVNYLY